MITVRPPRLPETGNVAITRVFETVLRWLVTELGKRTPDDTVRGSLLLRSSDGSVWEVTVDDLGALGIVKVNG